MAKKTIKIVKTKRPTAGRINAEIASLLRIKPSVRETSAFGDNHHDAIDAQIAVLEKRMTCHEVYDEYGDETDSFAQNVLDEALEAHAWMMGERGGHKKYESPAGSWQELLVK